MRSSRFLLSSMLLFYCHPCGVPSGSGGDPVRKVSGRVCDCVWKNVTAGFIPAQFTYPLSSPRGTLGVRRGSRVWYKIPLLGGVHDEVGVGYHYTLYPAQNKLDPRSGRGWQREKQRPNKNCVKKLFDVRRLAIVRSVMSERKNLFEIPGTGISYFWAVEQRRILTIFIQPWFLGTFVSRQKYNIRRQPCREFWILDQVEDDKVEANLKIFIFHSPMHNLEGVRVRKKM